MESFSNNIYNGYPPYEYHNENINARIELSRAVVAAQIIGTLSDDPIHFRPILGIDNRGKKQKDKNGYFYDFHRYLFFAL